MRVEEGWHVLGSFHAGVACRRRDLVLGHVVLVRFEDVEERSEREKKTQLIRITFIIERKNNLQLKVKYSIVIENNIANYLC